MSEDKIKLKIILEIDRNEAGERNKDKPVQFYKDWYKGFLEQGKGTTVMQVTSFENQK